MAITIDRITAVRDDDVYSAFPVAALHPSGLMVAVWTRKADHYSWDENSTWTATSSDLGVSWSQPQMVSDRIASTVALTQLGDRMALLEMTYPYAGWIRVSGDGVAWSEKRHVRWTVPSGHWTFPCDLAWIDDGTADGLMLATCYSRAGIFISASRDAGLTWQDWSAPRVTTHATGNLGESESVITQTAAGDLIMLTRWDKDPARGGEYSTYVRRSTDLGRTWSEPEYAYRGSGMPHTTMMPDGTLIANVRDQISDSTPNSWSLAVSRNHGRTWSVDELSDGWMMYGQLVVTGDTTAVHVGGHQVRGSSTDCDILALHLTITDAVQVVPVTVTKDGEERWVWGDFITGQIQGELHPLDGSTWEDSIDESQITVKLATNATSWAPGILSAIYPWTTFFGVLRGDEILAAGPVTHDTWDADSQTITMHARGGEAYLSRREFMPLYAQTAGWDFYDRAKKEPKSWAKTTYADLTWPQVASKVVSQMRAWRGAGDFAQEIPNLTISTGAGSGRTITKEMLALDHPRVDEILDEMEGHSDGIEWQVRPVWASTPAAGIIQWRVILGNPLIVTNGLASWSHDSVHRLRTSRDGRELTTVYHATGGRAADEPLSVTRTAAGSRLMLETHDSSYGWATNRTDLARATVAPFRILSRPILDYEFAVSAATVTAWRPGDFALLTGDSTASLEHDAVLPHLPRETRLRIIGRSGRAGDDLIDVRTQRLAPEDDDAWLSYA